MAVMMRDYHGHRAELATVDEVVAWFDEQADAVMPHGGSGQTIWVGPVGAVAVMRVDVDIDVDRAALSWLPDDSYAVELESGEPITVFESADTGPVTVPAERARVTAATARAAVGEYATSGARPACVRWTN